MGELEAFPLSIVICAPVHKTLTRSCCDVKTETSKKSRDCESIDFLRNKDKWSCVQKPGHFAKFKRIALTKFLTLKKRTCPGNSERMATLHYGQVYGSQKVNISWPMLNCTFFFVLVGTISSQNIWHYLTPCIYILYRMFQKHWQGLVCCAVWQTDHRSRRNSCPETQGLVAAERRILRTNGSRNLFRFVFCPNTAGMQPFSHLQTLIEMCGITSTLHIQIDGLVEEDQFRGQHGHQIWHLSTIFCGVVYRVCCTALL